VADSGAVERELTSYVNSQSLQRNVDTAEASTFADEDKVFVVGLRDNKLTIDGYIDATVDGYLQGLLGGTPRAFKVFPAGSASGLPYNSGSAILTSYQASSEIGDVVKFSAEFQVSGSVTRGTV
jgi:hypothetical protein